MKLQLAALVLGLSVGAQAKPIKWTLENFVFYDQNPTARSTATGSFIYDNETRQFSEIDIWTTDGEYFKGLHYIATAGEWGKFPQHGTVVFSDTVGPDFNGAGWLRLDIDLGNPVSLGVEYRLLRAPNAESRCMDATCSKAYNEYPHPWSYRELASGSLRPSLPVPEPSSVLLSMFGLAALVALAKKR